MQIQIYCGNEHSASLHKFTAQRSIQLMKCSDYKLNIFKHSILFQSRQAVVNTMLATLFCGNRLAKLAKNSALTGVEVSYRDSSVGIKEWMLEVGESQINQRILA